eukprot:CAMPEP_0198147604 /NCGR_PEP_ID=MMETSP1443-20131203/36897_1 /TAXON_ID=186043 /ORGANISM="Entomoneis sp., Strain CCMP2396" /LENGTH=73 /DNA_ID=CAMNT_0043812013 /DNA_START=157 /DNA_END=378 /DNA_ORIENTATION=-
MAAVGYGCVYLPFVADRDEVRGFHEEDDRVIKKQYEQYIREMKAERNISEETPAAAKNNSMWKAMKGPSDGGK